MRYFLENEYLKVEVDSFGAEVKSVLHKKNYREYLWYGNPKFWGRSSPVLFPFVGSLKNKEFRYQGKTYPMGQHGFARDFEHELILQKEDELCFSFRSQEETLERYPFAFELQCSYRLEENRLTVGWKVINPSDSPLHFSIGAHPAFLCPIHGESTKAGYQIYFDGIDELRWHGNDQTSGLAILEEKVQMLQNHRLLITPELFDECTIFVEGRQTGLVGIEDPKGNRMVDLEMEAPLFAIWSPEGKNAPFLCIEPWYGRCDAEDFEGELQERDYNNCLVAGECFEASYSMRFYEI